LSDGAFGAGFGAVALWGLIGFLFVGRQGDLWWGFVRKDIGASDGLERDIGEICWALFGDGGSFRDRKLRGY